MNCLFINYSGYPKALNYFCPDNGLALLSTILNQSIQHRAFVLDYCSLHYTDLWEKFWKIENEEAVTDVHSPYMSCLNRVFNIIVDEILDFIEKNTIQVIGFKLWTGEGFRGSSMLAGIVKKKFPNVLVIAGGPHIDYFGHYIYKETDSFDCLICADGEMSLLNILDNVNNRDLWHSIPNLLFKEKGILITTKRQYVWNLNKNPTPEYSPETYIYIKDKLNFFVIEDTRGCPNNCNYCIEPIKSGNKIRSRKVEYIIKDIVQTKDSLNSKGFRFSCSSPNIEHRNKLAEKLISGKLDVKYATFQTVKNFNVEHAKLLKNSGCYNVFIGVESFSEKVLIESYGKKQSFDEISKAIRVSKDAGIYTQIGLIYPSPIEDNETKKITFLAAREIKPDSIFVLCPIVTPFTAWGGDPESFNINIPDVSSYYQFSMNYDIKHTGNEKKWSLLDGITINGKSHSELIAELSILLTSVQEVGIETQISIEIPILAHCSQQISQELNNSFVSALNNFDIHKIKEMILDLNYCLSK